ncbi:Transcriptional activator protein UGA3 [Sphaceloma murrayae]|uniref:Transcriptional activator protein UGA3 n=1 Tax=Sphaceloma murrayae TaxID=2082308 RepID=A0A2K1QP66_9PEZI|nr:Transcriptional activator protein UGA3 [Sphaceloma murrayae]
MAASDVQTPALEAKTNPAPRKRRRRAAASGAAEDCFTCRKRSTQCDRKRPYCSQCLEVGKECGGYRTTLTWGVGVASRGKLRGLTCPVAGRPVAAAASETKPEIQHRRKTSNASTSSNGNDSNLSTSFPAGQSAFNFAASLGSVPESRPIKIEHPRQHLPSPSLRLDIPPMAPGWPAPHFGHPVMHGDLSRASFPPSPMHLGIPPMQQPFLSPGHETTFPSSAHSVTTFSDSGFMTPHEFPPTPASYAFSEQIPAYAYSAVDSLPPSLDSANFGSDMPSSYQSGSPAYHNGSPHSTGHSSEHSYHETMASMERTPQPTVMADDYTVQGPPPPPGHESVFSQFEMTLDDMMATQQQQEEKPEDHQSMQLTLSRPVYTTQFFHLPQRMQSLLDFYDKHICSVLVAFDGATNPYRAHILTLAAHNEGLQNAIAALATNNIRMRSQKHLQAPGFVEELAEEGPNALHDRSEPSAEETCYKALSIDRLNLQLAHPGSVDDDSVLATLLILCLFHVCDSGFSKFKTQLAGVQKLLQLRGPARESGFIGWVQMFFTWFDVMTSTVNDRETEIENESLDMLDFSTDLGALEQFSGCDGRLFKLIARLGRLNLLAQDRPVRDKKSGATAPSQKQFQNQWRRPSRSLTPRPVKPEDYYRLDGNGWSTPLEEYDNDTFNQMPSTYQYPDSRTEFWTEWYDIRSRLQSWSMDYNSIPGPSSPNGSGPSSSSLGPEQRDLVHINESFRSSALLYTERLANPDLPSSAPNFQQLVAQGLFHITALSITSCVNKFLLWPLFIIGTECYDTAHRATVRSRCVEIQRESGFFNNLSVLEVLERAWIEADVEAGKPQNQHQQPFGCGVQAQAPFKWRKAMDRVDGEYIVV